jgi:hypothetical protein
MLPRCKKLYLQFEQLVLMCWYTVAFVIVPMHIAIVVMAQPHYVLVWDGDDAKSV